MKLTHAQKKEMLDLGYTHIPGVVPPVMVDAARKAINHSIGNGFPSEDVARMRTQSWCADLQNKPVVTDLINKSPAFQLLESLLGEGRVSPVGGGQIALRFPGYDDPPKEHGPHIDGFHAPLNGVPAGTLQNFTALALVFLSDCTQKFSGTISVFPGGHKMVMDHIRVHSPEAFIKGMPQLDWPKPVHVLGKAGDLVLTHYLCPHAATFNVMPDTRYCTIYRILTPDFPPSPKEGGGVRNRAALIDPWSEWPGIQELLEKKDSEKKPASMY